MLKYTDTKVVFREIPDEITLAVNISGCPCACEGCHSSYLAEDIGEVLTDNAVTELIARNDMISCLSFMGGDREPSEVSRLARFIKNNHPNIKVGWYSGRDELSPEVEIKNFDYIKIGSYQSEFGGLDSPTTNQRLYKVLADCTLENITARLQPRF
ncbi:MAG: anaerobic ribonucleoside-triphosphate reductase activating protein [Rikenellaceae bacterium]